MTKQIGTFTITALKNGSFKVKDECKFNNWGVEKFSSLDDAEKYAAQSHNFKTGR